MTNDWRSKGIAMLATLILAGACRAQAHPCTLKDLGWMAGSWHNSADPERAQERWTLAPDSILMGSAWEFPPGKAGFAEIMSVRPDGQGVSMFLRHFDVGLKSAWEERGSPMVFTASSCMQNAAVFDGQGDHTGEHMAYRRSGDMLSITADFLHHGTPDHQEWQMIRAGN
jgi:Domain of unknown function (DUF6265)